MAKRNRFASEAAMSAVLRYDPQLRALLELQREAQSTYKTGVAQARGNADASIATIQGAQRQVGGFYDQAGLDQARTASIVNRDVAGLQGLSPDLQAAIGLEQANAASRVSSGRAQTLSGLSQQMAAARAGGQYASNKAYDDLVTALQKIGEQRMGILSDKSTFTASEQARLAGEARDRALRVRLETMGNTQSERNSLRSSGIDPDTGKPIPGGKLDPSAKKGPKRLPGGAKLATVAQHGAFQDQVDSLHAWIEAHKDDYKSRAEMAHDLSEGVPASTVTDPKTGQKIKDPGVPKASSQLALSVALDLGWDGAISRHGFQGQGNLGRLHSRGYSVKRLGYAVQPARSPRKAPRRRSPASAIPLVGGQVR
jgi:hypothetical protein